MSFRGGKKWNIAKNSDGTYTIEQRDIKYGLKGYVLCAQRVYDIDKRNDSSTYVNVHRDSNNRSTKKWRIYRA